ncbi:MAG TPA: hypothetical protein VK484_04955 [Ferruginibacter sp.]|nr:hypothetical protein [Ferruginibacter sp.]
MKRTIHALTVLFFPLLISGSTMAQFGKGGKFVEGGFGGISYSKSDNKSETGGTTGKSDSRSFGISLYPRIGFFIADNFAVGAEVDIAFTNSKSNNFSSITGVKTSDTKGNYINVGIGPFARYYFSGSADGKSKFYGQVGGSINADLSYDYEGNSYNSVTGAKVSTTTYDYKKKERSYTGSALLGWNRFLTDNVALNLNLGYRYYTRTYTYNSTVTPVVGSPSTSPDVKYSTDNHYVAWNIGFTMFFPSKAQPRKK